MRFLRVMRNPQNKRFRCEFMLADFLSKREHKPLMKTFLAALLESLAKKIVSGFINFLYTIM